jgi:hypothetical protein
MVSGDIPLLRHLSLIHLRRAIIRDDEEREPFRFKIAGS